MARTWTRATGPFTNSGKKNGQWVVNLADPRKADLLQDVLDQLNLGEMPPKKTGVKQPKTAETKQAIAWLTKVLLDFEEEGSQ